MKAIIIVGLMILAAGIVVAASISKANEDKIKEFISVDFGNIKDFKINDMTVSKNILIISTELDGRKVKIVTTDYNMNKKILKNNPNSKNTGAIVGEKDEIAK